MCLATEEAITIRCMLCSLGIKVSYTSHLSGDNAGVVSNTTNPDATLKKKHIALSFHSVRKIVSAGIVSPNQISSENNIADLLTKSLDRNTVKAINDTIGFSLYMFHLENMDIDEFRKNITMRNSKIKRMS
jgi:hypothetical protein